MIRRLQPALAAALGLLAACSSGGGRLDAPVDGPPSTSSAPSAARPFRVVWRAEWRTSRGRTVCPTGRLVPDRAGNIYVPGTFWGRLDLPGSSHNAENERAILLRVDPAGAAAAVPFGALPEDRSRTLLEPALIGQDGSSAAAITREPGGEKLWSVHSPMAAPASAELRLPGADGSLLVGDDAVVSPGSGADDGWLTFTRAGGVTWSRSRTAGVPLPGMPTHVAYDGRARIAVAGSSFRGAPAGVTVFDLKGSLLWHAPLDMFALPRIVDLQFDAEGALWVLGSSSRTTRVGDEVRFVTKKPPPGVMTDHIIDGLLLRYDARGRTLFAKTFPAQHLFGPSSLDVHTNVGYFVTTVWGPMPPISATPSSDESEAVTFLVGVDRAGSVKLVERIGGRTRGVSHVLAHDRALTVVVAHAREDGQGAECEFVRYATP